MEYVVKVYDIFKGLIIYVDSFTDANTAYHVKREMEDLYHVYENDQYQVTLIEPEE